MINIITVNICRPGHNASCALCCGSHNYAVSFEELDEIYMSRALSPGVPVSGILEIRESCVIHDGMQCANVGYTDVGAKISGCLVYNGGVELPGEEGAFFRNTCRNFFCKSSDILTDEEILFAARLTGDCFFYPLLINEIQMLKKITAIYQTPGDINPDEYENIKKTLIDNLYNRR